jgi:hypothetical protein
MKTKWENAVRILFDEDNNVVGYIGKGVDDRYYLYVRIGNKMKPVSTKENLELIMQEVEEIL